MHRLVRAFVAAAIASPIVFAAGPAHAAFPGRNGLIAWSKVFFTRDAEIFVMRPDGSDQHQLTHNSQTDFDPAWSADGSKLDFIKQNFAGTSALWVMDADGLNQKPLTDAETIYVHPNWSPDGTKIAFASDRDRNFELYTIAPNGGGLTRLTFTTNQQEDNPNWSPDGRRLAFDACVSPTYPSPGSPNYEIVSMRADGFGRHRLTNDPTIDWNPAWSPNGAQIVFRSDRSPDGTELWEMNADGSNVVQLTIGPYQGGVDPDWQPWP